MQQLKLGKTKARKYAITLKFGDYVRKDLPAPPITAGHKDLLEAMQLGMLGNDQYGDCVWAGAAHETMLWNAEAGKKVVFSDKNVLADYTAVTGFDPNKPHTDGGTDMQQAAKYRQDVGVVDRLGRRHKIKMYLAVDNDEQVRQAIYLFGAVGIGIQIPSYAMEQFNAGKPWMLKSHGKIEGGHYIPGITYDKDFVYIITWGKVQAVGWSFLKKYMDEGVVYLSEERLKKGISLEGFDLKQLQADFDAIKAK